MKKYIKYAVDNNLIAHKSLWNNAGKYLWNEVKIAFHGLNEKEIKKDIYDLNNQEFNKKYKGICNRQWAINNYIGWYNYNKGIYKCIK